MLLGHALGEAVLVARRGNELFAIAATCTHYGGRLAKGLMVDCTVRCPWHHARFDLRTGEAIAGPALNNGTLYKIDKRGQRFFVTSGRQPTAIQDRHVQLDDGTKLDCDFVVVGIGVRPNIAIAEQAGIATDNGVLVDEFLETNTPGIFAAGDIACWPDPRAGRIRVEHWVVAERQGQTAARNILGTRERFAAPPFFWSNHFDVHIHYVGHGSGADQATVSGSAKAKDASVIFRDGDKLTAVASVGRDKENLRAELALERGEKFSPS